MMLSAFRAPFNQTRPAVNDQNAQSNQSTCRATSTTVIVTRLKIPPLPPTAILMLLV